MKSVDTRQVEEIRAAALEFDTHLEPAVLEKDLLVTEAITAISNLADLGPFRLVFCGGTCLSKAYGLLDRMSEDVDFKVVQIDAAESISKSALRRALSAVKSQVGSGLSAAGFDADSLDVHARDSNQYIVINVRYETRFDLGAVLRPDVKIELNFTDIQRGTERRRIGRLLDEIIGREGPTGESDCINLGEAFTEKLIAFPRRYALHLRDPENRRFDKTLVRHLYDVARISACSPASTTDHPLLARLIEKDGRDFANQHPEFLDAPGDELRYAIDQAQHSPAIREQYDRFLRAMVYAPVGEQPSFDSAVATFSRTLEAALAVFERTSVPEGLPVNPGPHP